MRLTPLDIKRIRKLRYRDGLTIPATAEIVGCSEATVWHLAPGRPGKVPLDKLRGAFDASGLTATEVARRMGWLDGRSPDGARVKRALGIYPSISRGRRSPRRLIDAETAGLLAEAIGVMAWEVMPDDEQEAA